MTLLPSYTIDLDENQKQNLKSFKNPSPAGSQSYFIIQVKLKYRFGKHLYEYCQVVVRGAIAFSDGKNYKPVTTN